MCGYHVLPSCSGILPRFGPHALRQSNLVGIYGGGRHTGIGLLQLLHQCQLQITDPVSADQHM